MMNRSATVTAVLTSVLLAGHALTQNDLAVGVDFAVTKENVPDKAPI